MKTEKMEKAEKLITRVMWPKQDFEVLKGLAEHLGVKPMELWVPCPFLGMPFTTVEDFKNNMKSLYLRGKVQGYPPIYFNVKGGILCFRGHFMVFPDDYPWNIETKEQVRWVLLKDDGRNEYLSSLQEIMELFEEKSKLDALTDAIGATIKAQGKIEFYLK